MIPLICCQLIAKAYGARNLFQDLSISFALGDRIGLIGPNGAGKSTFLKLLAKQGSPDSGTIVYSKGVRVGYVPQYVEKHTGTLKEVLEKVLEADTLIEEADQERHLRAILAKVGFMDPEQSASELSGGWARRLSIAKALVNEPDILLLDEPTNHLDLDTILWLENFLQRSFKTFIVTSHDRLFLDAICNKIWELSPKYPKGIFSVEGGYSKFLEKRDIFLKGQIQYEKSLRSKSRREEEWLKQSPKARSTKSRARIQEAAKLRHELAKVQSLNTENKAELGFSDTNRQTKKLLVGKNLSKAFEGKKLFSGIDVSIMRGDRLGIVGENGSGKSTLLKILGGEIKSDTGTLKMAEALSLFYFDQHRESLDPDSTLRDALSPHGDTVLYRGRNIHINQWCEKFLFDKSRLDFPIKLLSGGEKARILIARLMTKPVDLLLLDEPTNDLDIDTLEILEESLDDFPGGILLISHDRAFMDRIADSLLALDNEGEHQVFNDTEAWLSYRKEQRVKKFEENPAVKKKESFKKSRLSYKEKQELSNMEETLLALGKELEALSSILDNIEIQKDAKSLKQACENLAKKQKEIEDTYQRWQDLEDRA